MSTIETNAVLVVCVLGGTAARGDDWPQYRHDAQRTGWTADQPGVKPRVAWVQDVNDEIVNPYAEVIVGPEQVYPATLNALRSSRSPNLAAVTFLSPGSESTRWRPSRQ